MTDFDRVVVTGANRGIGLEFVRQYLAAGSEVVAACREPEAADELRALGGRCEIVKVDVGLEQDARGLAETLDGRPVDLLISNAAILGGPRSRVDDLDWEAWRRAFEVNVLGAIRVATSLRENVRASRGRRIVIMGSRAGLVRGARAGTSYIYRSTKSALHTSARLLALDLAAEDVIVVLLNPGHVRTGIGGKRAPMEVTESVTGMRGVIAALTPDDAGRFWNHDGTETEL